MKRLLSISLTALALAGCGASDQQARADAHAKMVAACRASSLQWARGYEATLPSPGSPAEVARLAAPLTRTCIAMHSKR